jgi:hypothetical protein
MFQRRSHAWKRLFNLHWDGLDFHTMNFQSFKASLTQAQPPKGLSSILQAMWHDAIGDWDRAHDLAQSEKSAAGSWVHAYLHRVEGDIGNAGYWYGRAGKPACTSELAEEWVQICKELLAAEA